MPFGFARFILSGFLKLLRPARAAVPFAIIVSEGLALAQDAAATPPPSLNTGDTAWVLASTALVMLMTPGLAFFYAGMVRKKNVLSSCMHSFVALAVIGVQWMIYGYTLSFGTGNAFIGDFSQFLLFGMNSDSLNTTIPTYVYMWFQGMFAIITPALISGSIAERMKFSAYVLFLALWATIVYDPVAHWVWGGGWLQKLGALDFAGGTVVHFSSGVSALAMAIILGKRLGYPHEAFIPHNLSMTLLGAALLWFGWFGYNSGSALAANGLAGLAFCTTMTASAAAAFSWMMMEWIFHKKPSALGIASGLVAGLVVITPAAGYVTPAWSLVMGLMGGIVCYYGVRIKLRLHFDDSLDVVGVHGVGGAFGAICTGIFASIGGTGWLYGDIAQFGKQVLGVAATGGYAFIMTYIIAVVIDKTVGLRVDPEEETIGLDRELHGEVGYTF
ncbi:MAG: ammonium transporter [Desulfobacteraceae bacterium]|nr:ammonium transporter [Desulfobacteraceae bacterium]